MRFLAILAAMAATLTVSPALAQGGPKAKPEVLPFTGVADDTAVEKRLPAALPADPENTWVLDLSSGGRVLIRLRPDAAPKMVEQVKTLTRKHFYDGVPFHRVIDGDENMAQGGDPTGTGTGDSDMPDVPAEFNALPHVRGAVSAARTQDVNSANSQFFIMFGPRLGFDRNYTVFGRVVGGMEFVDKIERGEPPQNPTRIVHAYVLADNPPAYQAVVEAPKALPAGEERVKLVP
ncbi:MAG: peptidylprolyl isomerase [Pseudomonadota bacterium]